MPIRWYGPANTEDPTYRHFNRIVNLVLHGMVFAALNSGLWFVQEMRHPFPAGSLTWVPSLWAALWLGQLIWVILQRPNPAE